MRPIFALGMLLAGLNGAALAPEYQTSRLAAESTSSSPLPPSIGKADRWVVLPVPAAAWVEAGHEQTEEFLEPQPSPAAAGADIALDEPAPPSVDDLCNALLASAEDNDLPVPFFANLIWQESRLRHDAVSPVGALGIAQFMPEVAVEAGVGDPFDPGQAIPASARLLHALRRHFGNLGFVAAAYNAGAHRVNEWLDHRRALPRETRDYVARVTGRSVEAWRKSPVDDVKLTFARPLPCRELPAYADLEQARQQQAEQLERAQELRQAEELQRALARPQTVAHNVGQKIKQKVRSELAQQTPRKLSPRIAQEVSQKIAQHDVQKIGKEAGARIALADRKRGHETGHAASGIMARNFHAGRHDASRRQHAPYERRKIANGERLGAAV